MSYEVIAHTPDCEGGSCPTFRLDRETGTIAIQGDILSATEVSTPEGEGIVTMPLATFLHLVKQVQA